MQLRRSRAREVVLQLLYQDDLNADRSVAPDLAFLQARLHNNDALVEFADTLLNGVRRNRQELDNLLSQNTNNWSLHRMAATDRNVLRLGAFEVLYTDAPRAVAINEAVELAKRFGSKQSSQFVNGVLDGLKPANLNAAQEPMADADVDTKADVEPVADGDLNSTVEVEVERSADAQNEFDDADSSTADDG